MKQPVPVIVKKLSERIDGYKQAEACYLCMYFRLDGRKTKCLKYGIRSNEQQLESAFEIESDLNNTIGFMQSGLDQWKKECEDLKAKLAAAEKEIVKLNTIKLLLARLASDNPEFINPLIGAMLDKILCFFEREEL